MMGRGVYGLAEAAKLTNLRPARVREWFRPSRGLNDAALFRSDYPAIGDDKAISFLDLIEVYIVGSLREADPPVSLQRIRRVHEKASLEVGHKHPFCVHEVYHGQGQIFTRRIDEERVGQGPVIDPLADQAYFDAVILPFLAKIEYDHPTNLAKLWRIAEGVVVDPEINFGKPTVEEVGKTTRILAGAFEANGRDAERVARWYGVEPRHIRYAVDFEHRRAS